MQGQKKKKKNSPVPRAFKPVEDVCASGVVNLVEGVSVGLLDSHGVAKGQERANLCTSNLLHNIQQTRETR